MTEGPAVKETAYLSSLHPSHPTNHTQHSLEKSLSESNTNRGAPYLNMSHGEYDGVRQVDFVAVFVDGRRYNGRVDDDRVVCVQRLAAELHAGVFSGQIRTQMLVQDERHPDLP